MGLLPPADPNQALVQTDRALGKVTNYRSIYGALQNRMEHALNNTNNSSTNLTSAESRIRDADMNKELLGVTKSNILIQAAHAMLAQANQNPQTVLQLLK
ncbi:flagellin [Paenibacillus marchantiae]|nr:flagellin [Paenibacillus marchantiae]WDQ35734.1 flagellin [Paenibacillus marchantiae]